MNTLLFIKAYEQFSCKHIKLLIQKGTLNYKFTYKGYTYFSHKVSSIEDCHKNYRHPVAKFAAANLTLNAWIQAQGNKVCQPDGQHVWPDRLCHFPSRHETSWDKSTKHDKRNGLYYSNKFSCAMFLLSNWNGFCLKFMTWYTEDLLLWPKKMLLLCKQNIYCCPTILSIRQ